MNALPIENIKFVEAYVGWTRGKAFVSRAIQRLDDSYFNHIYRRFVSREGISLVYESHISGGVQITPYEHILSAATKGKIKHPYEKRIPIEPYQVQLLWNDCLPLHGKEYDTHQILSYYAWIRFWHRSQKRKGRVLNLNRHDKYTCNEFYIRSGMSMDPFCKGLDYSDTPESIFRVTHGGKHSKEIFGVKNILM